MGVVSISKIENIDATYHLIHRFYSTNTYTKL